MSNITLKMEKFRQNFRDAISLFKWFLWVRILAVGWALPFEFINILVSIAIFFFYTFTLTGGATMLEGYAPIQYIIIGLFVRSLVNIGLPSIYESVNDFYRGFWGGGGVRMSMADYIRNLKMSIYSYILANLFSVYIREIAVALIYILVGVFFYNITLPPADVLVIAIITIFLGSIASLGMGFLAAATIWMTGILFTRSPIIWFFDIIISLASGIYFPVEVLPPWLKTFSYILPHFYCIKIIRSAFNPKGVNVPFAGLITLFVFTLTLILTGLYIFHLTYEKRGERGPPTPM